MVLKRAVCVYPVPRKRNCYGTGDCGKPVDDIDAFGVFNHPAGIHLIDNWGTRRMVSCTSSSKRNASPLAEARRRATRA